MKSIIKILLGLFKKKVSKQVEEVKEKVVPAQAAPEKKKKKYYHPKPKKANL
jgi:hypothetical protein